MQKVTNLDPSSHKKLYVYSKNNVTMATCIVKVTHCKYGDECSYSGMCNHSNKCG